MSNIEQNLQKILSSRYGKDVRQSIHDGIHDCYEDGKAGAVDLVAREQIANLVANNNPTEGNSELLDIRVGADGTAYDSAGEAVRRQVFAMDKLNSFITPIFNIRPTAQKSWHYLFDSGTKTYKVSIINYPNGPFGYAKKADKTGGAFVITSNDADAVKNPNKVILFKQDISYVSNSGFVALAGDLKESSMKLEPLYEAYINDHYIFAVMYESRIFTGPNQELFDELDNFNDFIRGEIAAQYDLFKLGSFITPIFNVTLSGKKTWTYKYDHISDTYTLTPKDIGDDVFAYFYADIGNHGTVSIRHGTKPTTSGAPYIMFNSEIKASNVAGFASITGDVDGHTLQIESLRDALINDHFVFAVGYRDVLITGLNQRLFSELDTHNSFLNNEFSSNDKLNSFITPIFNIRPTAQKSWHYLFDSGTKTYKVSIINYPNGPFGYAKKADKTGGAFVITSNDADAVKNPNKVILFKQDISYVSNSGFVALAGDLKESSMKLEPLYEAYINDHYIFAVMYESRIFTGPNQELFDELDNFNDFIRGEIERDIIDYIGNANIIDSEQRRNLLSSFRSIGVIGDSLSVGYLKNTETELASGRNLYYSWPQYMARKTGQHVINIGASGYNVKTWMNSAQYGWGVFSNEDNYCQAYIIGLGVNDASDSDRGITLGSISDVNLSDYTLNGDTYYGGYAKIIQRGRTIRPNSIFFCLTNPTPSTKAMSYNQAIRDVVEYLNDSKVFVVDLYENYRQYYASPYFLKEDKNAIRSHYSPLGYEAMVPIISAACSEVMEKHLDIFCQLFTIDDAFQEV